jgi:hypothetical protein
MKKIKCCEYGREYLAVEVIKTSFKLSKFDCLFVICKPFYPILLFEWEIKVY